MSIPILIPFELKDEIKKTSNIVWNAEEKSWYCNKITPELEDYEIIPVAFDYKNDREVMRKNFKSLRYNPKSKLWEMNKKDFKEFMSKS